LVVSVKVGGEPAAFLDLKPPLAATWMKARDGRATTSVQSLRRACAGSIDIVQEGITSMKRLLRGLLVPVVGLCCWSCTLTSSTPDGGEPSDTGGSTGTGGRAATGGATGAGGSSTGGSATGGSSSSGGSGPSGGSSTGGGTATGGSGGGSGTGGRTGGSAGGSTATGGAGSGGAAGGASGTGGTAPATKLPCDIYKDDGGPCVAAHSTVRALSAAYNGPLYQVKKADGTTKDVTPLAPGGLADSSIQDTFCGASACTISIIYDQSGMGNHLTKTPPGGSAKPGGDNEADAKALPIMLGGKKVYGEHNPAGVGYRNNKPKGTATGDNAETMYAVLSGDYYNNQCCFDYGNMETNTHDNGEGTMEAIYFGNCTIWGKGGGSGPWVMGDLENGLWAGNSSPYANNKTVNYKYVTSILKGGNAGENKWGIFVGNAQSGSLEKMFEGVRPNSRYNPMRKEGAIGLGTGGDNSNSAQGNFFEGVMTAHYSKPEADALVQANIVSVYGTP
jgi:hypothetical protein